MRDIAYLDPRAQLIDERCRLRCRLAEIERDLDMLTAPAVQPVTNGRLLSVSEAAHAAGVSKSKVYQAIESGVLCARRLGPKSIRIARVDLERWTGTSGDV